MPPSKNASAKTWMKTSSTNLTRSFSARPNSMRPTERIVGYLNDKDIPINVLFFQVFQHGDTQLLSRTWLIDPVETQENASNTASTKREREPWNGEFYGSFGDGLGRRWEEARQYGFFSAGGGSWYSQTLSMLSPGDLIWGAHPKTRLCRGRQSRSTCNPRQGL